MEELFANAALGMTAFIFDEDVFRKKIEGIEVIEASSTDQDALLVDWLSEILYLSHIRYRAYIDYQIKELTPTKIVAESGYCQAEAVEDIKAVTYHGLKIEKTGKLWQAAVIYDI